MYEFIWRRSIRVGLRLSVIVVSLVLAAVPAWADKPAAERQGDGELQRGVDLEVEFELVPSPPRWIPYSVPADFIGDESEDEFGLRASCPSFYYGGADVSYGGDNRLRGNLYAVDPTGPDRKLCEFKMRLNAAVANTPLCFVVYEHNPAQYRYDHVWHDTLNVPAGWTYHATGTINLWLTAGKTYLIGVAWESGTTVSYCLDSGQTYPQEDEGLGSIVGGAGVNGKACSTLGETISEGLLPPGNGVYAQELRIEPPMGACCMGASCVMSLSTECAGEFSAPRVTCDDIICPMPLGICCCSGESCDEVNEHECERWSVCEWLGTGVEMTHMFDFNTNGIVDASDHAEFVNCMEFSRGPAGFPGPQTCYDVCDCPTNGVPSCDTNGLYSELAAECVADCNCGGNGLVCSNGLVFDPEQYCLDACDSDGSGAVDILDYAVFQQDFGKPLGGDLCNVGGGENPCAYERGACCLFDGTCEIDLTELECTNLEGTWRGDGGTCAEPCPILGACCRIDQTCDESIESGCGGLHNWCEGVPCAYAECAPFVGCPGRGGCCLMDGSCAADVLQGVCENNLGGVYLGDDATCDPNPCEAPVACCAFDGTCAEVTAGECLFFGGTPGGLGSTCAGTVCPAYGACCAGSYCLELEADDCPAGAGFSWLPGVDCSPSPCAGACCDANDACEEVTLTECDGVGGTFAGNGVPCGFDTCPMIAACCIGTSCVETDPTTCGALSGTWYVGEVCVGATAIDCANPPAP